ncbi:MAG: hypothetical protein P8L98_02170 [Planctomycetota bacterium]|nr:hypothetical protein [Planctomycetota bacterium]
MTNSQQSSELPPQVIAELRSMGDLQAPPELWQGVRTQLIIDKLETQQAPSELWDAVHTQLTEEGTIARPTKIFGLRPMYAAAAALLIVLGVAFQSDWAPFNAGSGLQLAPVISAEAKAEFRSRVAFLEVQPHEMSSTSRALAASLGGTISEVNR